MVSACVLSHFSRVQLFWTLWTVALQVPLSMGFSRQEHWTGFPFPSPGDLSDPGIELMFVCISCIAGRFFTTEPLGKPPVVGGSLQRRSGSISEW